jgi:PEP-CTERM motif-containing protein
VHALTRTLLRTSIASAICWLSLAPGASAEPFTLTTTLTGDFRLENPDNLFVDITVSGDTTSNALSWTVDINSPLHPTAVLDAFAFNLAVDPALVTFGSFSPSAWSVTSSADNVAGSGGADFNFAANDPAGSTNNVTNLVNLTFTSTLSSGTWSPSIFFNAPLSTGGGVPEPGAQLGAHLRSLSTAGCTGCSSSGFATGGWTPTASVPEPSTLLLYGMGCLGAAALRRRRA